MYALTAAASLLASTLISTATAAAVPAGPSGLLATYYGQKGVDIDALCEDPNVDVVPIAFVTHFPKSTNDWARQNFAANGWADEFYKDASGKTWENVFNNCHSFISSVDKCQANGKKVLISMGGDERYSDVTLKNDDHAKFVAAQLWGMFGPVQKGLATPRPFGNAVVDGFDFDVEGKQAGPYHVTLAKELKRLGAKYLSAAPQCPTTDALGPVIDTGLIDYVFVQFYNNNCAASAYKAGRNAFTDAWNSWSTKVARNPNAKLFLGLPASTEGAGAAYPQDALTPEKMTEVVNSVYKTKNFGGIMLWDYSLAAKNGGYQAKCKKALGGPKPPVVTTTSSSSTTTSSSSSTTTSSSSTTTTKSTTSTTASTTPSTTASTTPITTASTTPSTTASTTPSTTASTTESTTTSSAAPPAGTPICGATGFDLQTPAAHLVYNEPSTFASCRAKCSEDASYGFQSFAFSTEQCLCYAAPVAGNLNAVDSPIAFYDKDCPAPIEHTTSSTAEATSSSTTTSGYVHDTTSSSSAQETSSTTSAYVHDTTSSSSAEETTSTTSAYVHDTTSSSSAETTTSTTSAYVHDTTSSSSAEETTTTSAYRHETSSSNSAEETTTTTSAYVHDTTSSSSAEKTTTTTSAYVHTTTKPGHEEPTTSVWSDYDLSTTTSSKPVDATSSKPIEPTTTSVTYWGDADVSTTSKPVDATSSKTTKPTTTSVTYWGDADVSTSSKPVDATRSKPVKPTTASVSYWGDADISTSSKPSKPTTTDPYWGDKDISTSSKPVDATSSKTHWSDYPVPTSSKPVVDASTTSSASHWSDYPIPTPAVHTRYETVTVDVYVTECACTDAPAETPVVDTTAPVWTDAPVPTTIVVAPVSDATPAPEAPAKPEVAKPPVAEFTGAASKQGVMVGVSACVAAVIAGLLM